MKHLVVLTSAVTLGIGAQTASAYSAVANVTFTFGGSASGPGTDQGFVTSSGGQAMPGMSNSMMFSTLSGANSLSYYNQDFATTAQCLPGAGVVPPSFSVSAARKYGCRFGTTSPELFLRIPVVDTGPVGQAAGTLTVTDTTLTGTLTILATSDEPTGATTTFFNGVRVSNSIGNGFTGYNYRSGDGSPFGNVWYGITPTGTLSVNLTGSFDASSWTIDGGAVAFADPNFACQQGGFGGAAEGTLCALSTTGGGFSATGSHMSWGLDPDGSLTGSIAGPINVLDAGGAQTVAVLAGVLASLAIDGAGNITTNSGEFRRGSGSTSGGCPTHVRFDPGSKALVCGSIASGNLSVTGSVVPLPGVGWLMGAAMGVVGWMRARPRKSG